MGGSYMVDGGVIHAQTMVAYHRDGLKTAKVLVLAFSVAFGVCLWNWIATSHPAYAIAGGGSLLLMLLGMWLHIHHGKLLARWTDTLDRWEALRRDRLVHARHLKGFEL